MKKIHKHIGKGLRQGHRTITKYLFERDTLFSTLWVFIFIVGLGLIPLNLGVMNPVKLGLKDFDFNDMVYSTLGEEKEATLDDRIVIVNVGIKGRGDIAEMVDIVGRRHPKVMALDVFFQGSRDSLQDLKMAATLSQYDNVIVGDQLNVVDTKGDTMISTGFFSPFAEHAFVNTFQDDLKTVRTFTPMLANYNDSLLVSFPAAIIRKYDPDIYKELEKKANKKVIINYTRKIDYNDRILAYQLIEPETVLTESFDSSVFRDKIVLFGYVNLDPNDITDKKFTPMNERFAGKSIPDMNGIIMHANIISMVLDGNYIKKVPLWITILIAIVVCWLHMSFFIRYYLEQHIWFHLVAKIAQVLSAIFFVWLGIYLFEQYRLKVDLKLSILAIVLAVDVIYFYEAFAVWMHKKNGFKTIFGHHGHH